MFFTKRHSEVLVAGAGPVGMFAALLCAERGLEARIVDQEWRTSARSYALALHPRSLEILNGSGLTEELLRVGHKVDTIAFYEGSKRLGEIKLSALALPNPFLLVLPQSALEGLLEERLEQKKVELMWNHRLHGLAPSDIEVAVTLQRMEKASSGYGVATSEWVIDKEYVHKSSFVIGADGHRSIVRRDINAEYTYSGDPIGFAGSSSKPSGAPITKSAWCCTKGPPMCCGLLEEAGSDGVSRSIPRRRSRRPGTRAA
jgi:2-polyprenyl-6-methoxyphenol hydroxylase-like FAD-dependent oxidoreductase